MNKPKAPKDMSLGELLEEYKAERKCALCKYDQYCTTKEPLILGRTETIPSCMSGRIWMERKMNEPAPNPFTPDQIAWMRVEQQDAYFYAAMDYDGEIHLFGEEPEEDGTHWNRTDNYSGQSLGLYSWLKDFLTPGGPFLCFADYAPLEGADK